MENNMEITRVGYIRTTIRIHSFIPRSPKATIAGLQSSLAIINGLKVHAPYCTNIGSKCMQWPPPRMLANPQLVAGCCWHPDGFRAFKVTGASNQNKL